jgi:D-galacturonate reductase
VVVVLVGLLMLLTRSQLDFNPFYVKYSPDQDGHFDGQFGYGYRSLEVFINAARAVTAGQRTAKSYEHSGLPTIRGTVLTTAILHAGRISLDEKRSVGVVELEDGKWKLE